MRAPRKRSRRFAWLLIAAFGAGAVWALVPRGGSKQQASPETAERDDSKDLSKLRDAIEVLTRSQHQPETLEARRAALGDLLAQGEAATKLHVILAAVAADPTPPERDPLWAPLVEALAGVWRGDTLTWGLDLMITETRPRARQALVSSFARVATSDVARELTSSQTQTLTNHFIDMYGQGHLPSSQRPEVEQALRRIAGNDVADILQGKGLNSDDELEIHREHNRALAEATQVLAQQPPTQQPAATP